MESTLRLSSRVFYARPSPSKKNECFEDLSSDCGGDTSTDMSDGCHSDQATNFVNRTSSNSGVKLDNLSETSSGSYSTYASNHGTIERSNSQDLSEFTPSSADYDSCYNSGYEVDGTEAPVGNYTNLVDNPFFRNLASLMAGQPIATSQESEGASPTKSTDESTDESPKEKKKKRRGPRNRIGPKSKEMNLPENKKKFKTEMCKNWIEKGKCSYSVRCRFAHGPHELASHVKNAPPAEKTKRCSTFRRKGYCPYGTRCQFIHGYRKMEEIEDSFFGKSLVLAPEARKDLPFKRLSIFESLSEESE